MANAMRTGFCTLDDVFRLRMKRFAPSAWKAERLLSGSRLFRFGHFNNPSDPRGLYSGSHATLVTRLQN